MKCPVDKSDMIVIEHEKIELDYCLTCSGVWFDSGEMELLVSTLEAVGAPVSREGLLTPSTARTDEAHRKCPVCGRGMNKTWLGNTKKALIDSCPIGDGLWFDSGELQHVLAHVKPPDSQESEDVISFLSGAFQSTYGEEKGG